MSSAAWDALGHASSGSLGTATSTAALYPLDLAITRLKAQSHLPPKERHDGIRDTLRDVLDKDGFSALYSGLGPDVAKSVIDSFLFFGFYNYLCPRHRRPRVLEELGLGALAGACAKFVTTPVSNVVTLKQAASASEKEESFAEIMKGIMKRSGVMGLWSGYSATLVLTLNPSITFFVNRRLAKRIIPALEEEDIPVAWIAFLLAATSKATATALTYPFQAGKTRLQMASKEADADVETGKVDKPKDVEARSAIRRLYQRLVDLLDKSIFGVILHIIREEGVGSLYTGLQGEMLKSFFSHGLTMFMKGLIHRLIIRLWIAALPRLREARLRAKS